jgi:peptide deformylase
VNKKVVVIDEVIENERFYQVLINPIIRLYSRNLVVMQEACLSIPGISANVSRPLEVELEWQDVDGSTHKEMYTGFKARIIQHEVDHLKGILYIDRVNLSDRMKLFMALEHIKNKNVNPIYEIK